MSACNKMETVNVSDPAELGFYTIAQNATKGYVTGTIFEECQNPNNLFITGLYNNTVDAESPKTRVMTVSAFNKTDAADYFKSKTFKCDLTDGIWHNYNEDVKTPLYWPIGKDLEFLSYSSQNITGRPEPVAKWDGAKKVSFDITAEQCYQNDILYAQAAGSNRGTAADKNGSASTAGLPITFFHAQAWITFNVQVVGADAAMKLATGKSVIDVDDIVLENVYNSGVLTFEYKDGATQPTATWDFFTQNPTDVSVDDPWEKGFGTGNLFADAEKSKNGIQLNMLMPAQKHNDFVLYYTANGQKDSVVLPFTKGTVEGKFSTEDGGKWEMGKHYIYNVTLSINELTFAPEVTAWVHVTGFEPATQEI